MIKRVSLLVATAALMLGAIALPGLVATHVEIRGNGAGGDHGGGADDGPNHG